jgi:hypothetical protein
MLQRRRVGDRLWLGDVSRSLRTNIPHAGRVVGLVTVTAPGAQLLPWDESGEKVQERFARRWNKSAQKRWSELHRKAVQNVKRRTGLNSRMISYVWQLQARGVLHVHAVTRFDTEVDRIWTKHYVAELRRLAASHYFGFVDFRDRSGKTGKPSVLVAEKAAGYLSRYLTESAQFMQAIALEERPRRLVYVASAVTRQTHCTMRRLRRVRHLWAHRQGFCHPPSWAVRDLVELVRVGNLLRVEGLTAASAAP